CHRAGTGALARGRGPRRRCGARHVRASSPAHLVVAAGHGRTLACGVPHRGGARRLARDRHGDPSAAAACDPGRELRAGGGLSDPLGAVFAALADPTRREMLSRLLEDGTTSVPALTATLPITRQA